MLVLGCARTTATHSSIVSGIEILPVTGSRLQLLAAARSHSTSGHATTAATGGGRASVTCRRCWRQRRPSVCRRRLRGARHACRSPSVGDASTSRPGDGHAVGERRAAEDCLAPRHPVVTRRRPPAAGYPPCVLVLRTGAAPGRPRVRPAATSWALTASLNLPRCV